MLYNVRGLKKKKMLTNAGFDVVVVQMCVILMTSKLTNSRSAGARFAPETGCTFEKTRAHALYGFNRLTLRDVTKSECEKQCLYQALWQCKSFDYDVKRHVCYLRSESRRSKPEAFGVHWSLDHYDKLCDVKDSNIAQLQDGDCFRCEDAAHAFASRMAL